MTVPICSFFHREYAASSQKSSETIISDENRDFRRKFEFSGPNSDLEPVVCPTQTYSNERSVFLPDRYYNYRGSCQVSSNSVVWGPRFSSLKVQKIQIVSSTEKSNLLRAVNCQPSLLHGWLVKPSSRIENFPEAPISDHFRAEIGRISRLDEIDTEMIPATGSSFDIFSPKSAEFLNSTKWTQK